MPQNADEFPLTDAERESFRANGHVQLRAVAGGELALYRDAIRETATRLSTESRPLEERDTYGKAFLQTTNLWRHDATVREFVFSPRYARIAARLLGVEHVRLYHDQALFKEAGGGPTPWHQDQYYWPLDTDRTVTMWMPLVDIDAEMGMLTFASGSHRGGPIGDMAISDESDEELAKYISDNDFAVSAPERMSAGDATFHLGLTIHSAGANRSDRTREVMTVIYFADGARVTAPRNEHQQADLDVWLGGKAAGELADGALNPVIA